MEAIKLHKRIDRPIEQLPELDELVGADVEIIVLVQSLPASPLGPTAGAGRGRVELKAGWDDPIDDFKEYL